MRTRETIKHIFEYDKLIIGNNVEALFYSFTNNIPMIMNDEPFIYPFEFFKPSLPIEKLLMKPTNYKMKTPKGFKNFGVQKLKVFDRLAFTNSLAGLLPYNEPALDIVVDEANKELTIINLLGNIQMRFNELLVFDAKNVTFMDYDIVTSTKKEKIVVADWFYMDAMKQHDLDYIVTDDDFVKEVFFYISTETGFVRRRASKAAVAVSYLNLGELDDCLDVFARIRMQRELNITEFTSQFASGSRLKLSFDTREIKYPGEYINSKGNVKFVDLSAEQILDDFKIDIRKEEERLYPHSLLAFLSIASLAKSIDKWLEKRFKNAY